MRITVVGLGYVVSVASAAFSSLGHDVVGVDISYATVEAFRDGVLPIYEPGLNEVITESMQNGNLRFSQIENMDDSLGEIVVIATGTPTLSNGVSDLSQIKQSVAWSMELMPDEGIVLMKSTVPPGTGRMIKKELLQDTTLRYVANPEFLREGKAVHDWFHPERIVIGGQSDAISLVKSLYRGIDAPFVETDITSAEMIKYASNAFLATKISYINEIASLCDKIAADIDDVAAGIGLDSRIGSSFLNAGVGFGGSCLPKDLQAFRRFAEDNDQAAEIMSAVTLVNDRQRLLPYKFLVSTFGSISGLRVAVLGLAFKPDTDDIRDAPSIDLIRALLGDGALVNAYDPRALMNSRDILREGLRFQESLSDCFHDVQAILIMTEWPEIVDYDWKCIADQASSGFVLFDGRNALNPDDMISYGFKYKGVGRGVLSMDDSERNNYLT